MRLPRRPRLLLPVAIATRRDRCVVLPLRRYFHRLPLVRLGELHGGLLRRDRHTDPALHRGRRADGRHRRRQHAAGLPDAADVRARDVRRRQRRRPIPDGPRPAPQADLPDRRRRVLGLFAGLVVRRPVEDLAAVRQRRRRSARPTRCSSMDISFFMFDLPVPADGAELPVRRGGAVGHPGGDRRTTCTAASGSSRRACTPHAPPGCTCRCCSASSCC